MGSRYYYDKKTTVEQSEGVGINFLYKNKCFNRSWQQSIYWGSGEHRNSISYYFIKEKPAIRFIYTTTNRHSGEKKEQDYEVRMTTTPCNYGGFRYWFICLNCSRRVGRIYMAGSDRFYCRHCLNLSYEKRNYSHYYRYLDKILFRDSRKFNKRTKTFKGNWTKNYQRYMNEPSLSLEEEVYLLRNMREKLFHKRH